MHETEGFQLMGALPPRLPDQGLCSCTPLGAQPSDPNFPQCLLFPPNLGYLNKSPVGY